MEKPNIHKIIKGILAAFFGVQSSQNAEKDFSSKSLMLYILIGVIGVIIFIAVLMGIVSWVMVK